MRIKNIPSIAGALAAAALLACSPGAQAGVVVFSDGFESGDFSAWTDGTNAVWDGVDGLAPQAGNFAAFFGNPGGTSTISTSLSTVAGGKYLVSFWLQNEADVTGNAAPNSFGASVGGTTQMSLSNAPGFGYTEYVIGFEGTGGNVDLSFAFSQTAAFWDFDSVTVTLPEPASLALVGLAGALMAGTRRRKAQPPSP
ncbi:PEP-CTERM sorting domain-containing protein [Pelomonas sp. KK5]|uniref:PEP-CTERM sorting domain-containing protein n=1 Tax=Pelomonas sp. KK5 TaxID=1855730 RepID=UPI00097BDBD7|nr:PEP-CTERM sorting domain-containing protein [Pelomonas sp. KK5]